jgi:UDP-4-amino-4,6-dideoxy-N-acetyl-beta-L-altrosamine transaminase
MIPYGRQNISEEDIQAVVEVLGSDFLTQGPVVPKFEQALSDYAGANYAVAVSSATAGLHLACLALELGAGDWLWTTPITFVASANCGLYCGAKIDFVDIDPITNNICVEALSIKLDQASKNGCLPKVLVAVHLGGYSCDMEAIRKLSKEYGFRVIEDACHAIGGTYLNQPVGCCQYSDISVFSFHPVKTIATGEGGMTLTNDPELAERMALLRTHGITRESDKMTQVSDGPWYYQQVALGFNYRLSDIHAALGLSQLKRLDVFVAKRQQLADEYDRLLEGLPLRLPARSGDVKSGTHLYVIRLDLEKIDHSHREVFEKLRAAGIGVNLHYIPIHLQPYFKSMGFSVGDFPEAERYYSEAITIPMYYDLSLAEIDLVVKGIRNTIS